MSIDARARLLIACRDRIVQKGTELLKFTAKPVEMLRKARDGAPVGDFSAL